MSYTAFATARKHLTDIELVDMVNGAKALTTTKEEGWTESDRIAAAIGLYIELQERKNK